MSKDLPLVRRFAARVRRLERSPQLKYGKVASTSPLTVHLDGEFDDNDAPVATPAYSMVSTLTVGQLVLCVEQYRVLTVAVAQT